MRSDTSITNTKYYGYVTFTPKDYKQRDGLNGDMGEKSTDTTPLFDPSIKFSLFDYDGKINYQKDATEYTAATQRAIADYFPFKYQLGYTYPEYQNIRSRQIFDDTSPDYESPFDKWSYKQGHTTVNKTLDKTLNSDGYPVLNLMNGYNESTQTTVSDTSLTDEQRSLAYLFGGTNDSSVTKYTPKNTLLQKVSTHYTYDCNNNAVDYDTSENVFRLRNYTERIYATAFADQTENCDFLPLNYTDGIISGTAQRCDGFPYAGQSYSYNVRTDKANYWFGMRMDVDFIQGKDGKNENEEMVFKFSGDDDVWVFVDDVLVLDLGGIHGACTGTINFATGAIEQYEQQFNKTKNSYPTTLKACFDAAGKTPNGGWTKNENGEDIFADYTDHTMSFFYMERGSGASYCNIDFNLPTAPDKSVAVSKDVVDSNGKDLNASDSTEYTFKITNETSGGVPSGVEGNYTIGSDTLSVDSEGTGASTTASDIKAAVEDALKNYGANDAKGNLTLTDIGKGNYTVYVVKDKDNNSILTNKNRAQFVLDFNTSTLKSKTIYAVTAMKYSGAWKASDNYINYSFNENGTFTGAEDNILGENQAAASN